MVRAFAIMAAALAAVRATATPLRIKVAGPTHVYASSKDINAIVSQVEGYMKNQVHGFLGARSSFLKKGAWASDAKNNAAALFLTQPMRADSKLKLNVIEKEPATISQVANAIANASKAAFEREQFAADLAQLKAR